MPKQGTYYTAKILDMQIYKYATWMMSLLTE